MIDFCATCGIIRIQHHRCINSTFSFISTTFFDRRRKLFIVACNDDKSYHAYENLTGRYGIQNLGNEDLIVDNNPGINGYHMPLNIRDCTVYNG